MPVIDITVDCPLHDSFRVQQVAGMFELPPVGRGEPMSAHRAAERFSVEVPDLSEPWQVGVIVGPSGSGKSTVARAAFGSRLWTAARWPRGRAVIDCFGELPIKQITRAMTAVGFSSPPAWVKPYAVLSNGERFRCDLAKALLSSPGLLVFDEFTSVVDRTVAKICSAAVARAVRRGSGFGVENGSGFEDQGSGNAAAGASASATSPNPEPRTLNPPLRRFVAVTCHYDVVEWLEPDWVLDMAGGTLARGRVRRPGIALRIGRAAVASWRVFKRHHYLSASLHGSAQCFVGEVEGRPAAFASVIPFPHATRPGWREHRTVCLPDFQGVGIGNALSEFVASLFAATGRRLLQHDRASGHDRAPSQLAALADAAAAGDGAPAQSHQPHAVHAAA